MAGVWGRGSVVMDRAGVRIKVSGYGQALECGVRLWLQFRGRVGVAIRFRVRRQMSGEGKVLHWSLSSAAHRPSVCLCGRQIVCTLRDTATAGGRHCRNHGTYWWLGSRVVSVLDSGAEGPGFKSQPRRFRVAVLDKLFTPIAPLFTKQQNR